MTMTDINANIESTLNIIWNELKYKAVVHKEYGDIPAIYCYPQQLNQVFMNILVNAAQAIKEKGEIRITTRNDHAGNIEVRIQDNGIGIPEENISKLFNPFFTTKEVGKGTGLGLNVAYNIVQKHQGSIEIESKVGVGTTFIVRIPAKCELDAAL
jgi:signal transduction histidine kinase